MIMNVHGNRVDTLGEAAAVVREPVKPLVAKGLIDTAPKARMDVLSADRANEASIAKKRRTRHAPHR